MAELRDRPARKGKRWVVVKKIKWVYPPWDFRDRRPYLVSYKVEVFVTVDLKADFPPIEWDL